MQNLQTRFRIALWTTLAAHLSLIFLLTYKLVIRESSPDWRYAAVQIAPLLALIPGILSRHYRAYSWLCFVMLLYFLSATMNLFNASISNVDRFIFLTTIVLFVASLFSSRWSQRLLKLTAEAG